MEQQSRVDSRSKALRMGALALAALILGGHLFDHAPAAAAKGARAPSVPVVVGSSTTRDLPIALNGIGTVQPLSVVQVKVRVDGQLDKVAFTEGQEVRAGELLAQIDPRPFEAQQAQTEATRAKDQAQLTNARSDVERYATLIDTGGVSVVDGFTAVLSGLAPGETVVIDGQARIAPGTHVEAKREAGAGQPGAGQPGASQAGSGLSGSNRIAHQAHLS
jgi:membrane fusion protein, multidrug efflux system